MKNILLICTVVIVVFSACNAGGYNRINSDKFQAFVDTTFVEPSDLATHYLYKFSGNESPAMAKLGFNHWEKNGVSFVSGDFPQFDDSVDRTKIVIGYQVIEEKILIVEIRESWTCRSGRGNWYYSNMKCD